MIPLQGYYGWRLRLIPFVITPPIILLMKSSVPELMRFKVSFILRISRFAVPFAAFCSASSNTDTKSIFDCCEPGILMYVPTSPPTGPFAVFMLKVCPCLFAVLHVIMVLLVMLVDIVTYIATYRSVHRFNVKQFTYGKVKSAVIESSIVSGEIFRYCVFSFAQKYDI